MRDVQTVMFLAEIFMNIWALLFPTSLKRRKAAGADGIPPEFWEAICSYNSPACRWAVLLCNKAWKEGSVPTSWHEATVAAIFKKGDPACCENYRPISLLAVGYKIFAAILL